MQENSLLLARHGVPAILLVLLLVLEGVVPEARSAVGAERGRHAWRNLLMAGGNGILGVVVLAPLMMMVSHWTAANEIGLFYRIGFPVVAWGAVLLLFDLWMYGWHRINHEVPLLWRLHRVHHTDVAMDVTTALRFHPIEIALSTVARMALMPVLGMTATHLLVYELILLPVILIQHSNVRSPHPLDAVVRWIVVTPWMHRVHHSTIREETNSNYGSVLAIWDRLFGSWRWRSDPENIVFGLERNRDDLDQTVAGMLKAPFEDAKRRDG